MVHGHLGGRPPLHDLDHEQRLAGVLVDAAREGCSTPRTTCPRAAWPRRVCESVLRHGVGAHISLKHVHEDPFVALFSESAGRVLVSVVPGSEGELEALAQGAGIPVARLGTVDTDTDGLVVFAARDRLFDVDLVTLRDRHTGTLPAVFGH